MKKNILIFIVMPFLLVGCGSTKGWIFNQTEKEELIEKVEQVEQVSTNIIETVEVKPVYDELGNWVGSTNVLTKTPQVVTNLVTQTNQVPITYEVVEPSQGVEIVKSVGKTFGPIGEGIAGLVGLGLAGAAGWINDRKRKKAINEAVSKNAEDQHIINTILDNIDSAKVVIKELNPDKAKEYIDLIKTQQRDNGVRSEIRDLLDNR